MWSLDDKGAKRQGALILPSGKRQVASNEVPRGKRTGKPRAATADTRRRGLVWGGGGRKQMYPLLFCVFGLRALGC